MKRLISVFIFIIIGTCQLILAKQNTYSNTDSLTVQHLADLCKVWGVVKYFHPEIAYRKIDWDKALIESIPKVKTASNRDEFADAIQFMLDKLNDPETRVLQKNDIDIHEYKIDLSKPQPYYKWLEDSIVVVVATDYEQFVDFSKTITKFSNILSNISNAKGIIFDFRRLTNINADPKNDRAKYSLSRVSNKILSSIIDADLELPSYRSRYHRGFKNQTERTGMYYSGTKVKNSKVLTAKNNKTKLPPICFIINTHTYVDWNILLALQKVGKAAILAESNIPVPATQGRGFSMQLSDSLKVEIRNSELIFSDGTAELSVDSTVQISSDTSYISNPTIKIAIELLSKKQIKTETAKRKLPLVFKTVKENSYPEMSFPLLEYRLLALFRYWNAINYFFPYKELIGYNWDKTLYEFIPKLSSVKDSLEYNLTIAELRTRIHDSHAYVKSKVLNNYWGMFSPSIKAKLIDGKTIITKILDDSLAKTNQLKIGNEILTVDGENITQKRLRLSRYLQASNAPTLERNIDWNLLRGKKSSSVILNVSDGANIKEIKLSRDKPWKRVYESRREEPIWKIIETGCGYIDLDRLLPSQVDSAFEALRDTKMIIFDIRGYPNGTVWSIAPRLTEVPVKAIKLFVPIVNMWPKRRKSESFYSEFKPVSKWRYKDEVVILVNAETQSHAEYTCMILQACANTTIIGSTTAGADGNITNIVLPGGITATFTGLGVQYPDGRQTQRIGIIPDIKVKPTIKGIAAGRDEILERAIEFYHNKK